MAFDLNGVVETQLRNTIALLGRGFLSGPVAKDVQEHGNVCVNADKMDVIYLSVNALMPSTRATYFLASARKGI